MPQSLVPFAHSLVELYTAGFPARPRPAAGGNLLPEEADGRRWVLVVEDDPDSLAAVVELLEAEGFPAIGAKNGEEALTLLRGGWDPSLILVDLKMPVMDGWQFCHELEGDLDLRDIPVAIVTASASISKLPLRRVDAGFFQKPLDFPRLLQVIHRYCS